jgi:hypothetical protein
MKRSPANIDDWESWPAEVKLEFLEKLQAHNRGKVGDKFKKKYRNDRVAFVHDCVIWPEGQGPTKYQDDICAALDQHKRVAVRGPHTIGKTAIAALMVLHFALTRDGEDWKCPTTASSWRQLTKYLWPEIKKWSRRLRWDKIKRGPFNTQTELLTLNLKLETGEAFALASDDETTIEGAHADQLFYLFDEAKSITAATFDAAEGALAGGECYALAISTPGEPQGRFYDIHRRAPGTESWHVRHVTKEEAIAAGRMSEAWAEEKKRLWGEQSAVYANRVKGEFHSSGEDSLIPLSWVEAANERWLAWNDLPDGEKWLPFVCVSADIARSEAGDKTSLALRHGDVITELRRYAIADTMPIVGHVSGILNARGGYAVVDVIGVGGGPYDRLRELKLKALPFNASSSPDPDAKDRSGELEFLNLRAQAWWTFRERLDPAYGPTIALPPDDRLTGDLCAPKWKVTSSGKILIESKQEIKKRIGRSTDDGDAVVMAFYEQTKHDLQIVKPISIAQESAWSVGGPSNPFADELKRGWVIR